MKLSLATLTLALLTIVATAHADKMAAVNSTASLNQAEVERIDHRRPAGTIITAPMIEYQCVGRCNGKVVMSKIAKIQEMVIECKRDVMDVGEMNSKVRQIVDSMPNVKLSAVETRDEVRRRKNRRYVAGFCDDLLDLSRTPAFELASAD